MSENEQKPWYADLPSDEETKYEESVNRIRNGVQQANLSFEQAVELIDVADSNLKAAIVDDALKVLLAEMHFSGGQSLEDLSRRLKLSIAILEKARAEMLQDVEEAAIAKYKEEQGEVGNA